MDTRRLVPILLAVLVALALVATACGSDDDVATGDDGGDGPAGDDGDEATGGDVDGAWQLSAGTVDGDAIAVPDGYRITMTIDGDEVGGTAACNSYGGTVSIVDGSFTTGEIAWTEMGCEPDVMAAGQAFLTGFLRATSIARDGDDVVLSGESVDLRFAELPPPPTAELVDTVWELDTIIDGEAASTVMGEPATLELRSDGTLVAATGCRTLAGTWQESGDTIVVLNLAAEGECPEELARQDSHVISVLEGPVQATIDGQRLTLSAPGGIGLSFRATG